MILLPCNKCHKIKKTNRCSNCKSVYYCSVQCQKNDWTSHKYACERLKKVVKIKSKNGKKPKENSETGEKTKLIITMSLLSLDSPWLCYSAI